MERIDDFEEPITVPMGTYYSKRQVWMVFVCGMIVGVILSIILVLIEPK
jgi:hypothetical protein